VIVFKSKNRDIMSPRFIELPENPRLSSLGMNGARSEAE
jgi:hypothetical protein